MVFQPKLFFLIFPFQWTDDQPVLQWVPDRKQTEENLFEQNDWGKELRNSRNTLPNSSLCKVPPEREYPSFFLLFLVTLQLHAHTSTQDDRNSHNKRCAVAEDLSKTYLLSLPPQNFKNRDNFSLVHGDLLLMKQSMKIFCNTRSKLKTGFVFSSKGTKRPATKESVF